MGSVSLIEGTIRILRENVSGWATDDQNMKQVVPSHPPEEMDGERYPRATVDVIQLDNDETNVKVNKWIEDVVLEVTVYSTDSLELNQLVDDSRNAVLNNHTGTDSNGDEYLPSSYFQEPGFIGPTFENSEDKNVTRYNRSFEFEFKTLSESN